MACEETTRIFFKHKGLGNAPRFRIRIKFESTIQNYTEVSEKKDGTQPNYFSSRRKPLSRRGFARKKGLERRTVKNVRNGSVGRKQ